MKDVRLKEREITDEENIQPNTETEDSENNDTEEDEEVIEVKRTTKAKPNYSGEHLNYKPVGRKIPIMTDEEYIKDRLDNQIDWFNRKSSLNQKKYKKFKRIEFIIAATIPVIISLGTMSILDNIPYATTIIQIVAAIGGVILVIMNKLFELEEYFKFWKEYRATCETLQYERTLYLTRVEPYDEDDAFPMLVTNVETILSSEVQKWKSMNRSENQQKKQEKQEG